MRAGSHPGVLTNQEQGHISHCILWSVIVADSDSVNSLMAVFFLLLLLLIRRDDELQLKFTVTFIRLFFFRKSIQLLWGGAYKINSTPLPYTNDTLHLVWYVFAPWEENQSSRIKLPHSWNMQTAYRKKYLWPRDC